MSMKILSGSCQRYSPFGRLSEASLLIALGCKECRPRLHLIEHRSMTSLLVAARRVHLTLHSVALWVIPAISAMLSSPAMAQTSGAAAARSATGVGEIRGRLVETRNG